MVTIALQCPFCGSEVYGEDTMILKDEDMQKR
jgi:hypothetical protein